MHLRPRRKLAAPLKTVCRPVTMRVFSHTRNALMTFRKVNNMTFLLFIPIVRNFIVMTLRYRLELLRIIPLMG